MARNLPDPIQLRDLKYGEKVSADERSGLARRLREAGRHAEALDLFMLAGDEAGIEEMRRLAVEDGRPLLLLMLARDRRHAIPGREWKAAGDAALRAGRWREAFRAYTEAGDEDGLSRVREKLPDYELYVPQGKADS